MITSEVRIAVRYAETDMMGVVYHGSFLPWLEVGRTQLLREHGLPYRALEAQGFYLPVREVSLRYLKPARYDDEITVISELKEKPSVRIRIDYRLLREKDMIATGFTEHVFIDRQGRPVRPPPEFTAVMERLF